MEHRQDGYAEAFDDTTVVYNAVQTARGIRLVGPPLLNLSEDLAPIAVTLDGTDVTDRSWLRDGHQRGQASWIRDARGRELLVQTAAGELAVTVSPSEEDLFAGRRVLMTLSKDNDLDWILDWVRFHVRHHRVDAVLLYDNGSTAYGPEELAYRLAALKGLGAVGVVPWPFRYGPQAGPAQMWDSDYCQMGAFDDARWRFLGRARFMLNCDIDELLLAPRRTSLERELRRSPDGAVTFAGQWVEAVREERYRELTPRHAQYTHRDPNAKPSPLKWAVVPGRLPEAATLYPHSVGKARHRSSEILGYRHFRAISTGWKYARRDGGAPTDQHRQDLALAQAMTKAGLLPLSSR